jgi:hypothetical protein
MGLTSRDYADIASAAGSAISAFGRDAGGAQERQSFGQQNVVQPSLNLEKMIMAALGDVQSRGAPQLLGSPDPSGLIGSAGNFAGVDVGIKPGVAPFGAARDIGYVGGGDPFASLAAMFGGGGGGTEPDRDGGAPGEDRGFVPSTTTFEGGGMDRPEPAPPTRTPSPREDNEPDLGFRERGAENAGFDASRITDQFMSHDPRSAFGGGPTPTSVEAGFTVNPDMLRAARGGEGGGDDGGFPGWLETVMKVALGFVPFGGLGSAVLDATVFNQ